MDRKELISKAKEYIQQEKHDYFRQEMENLLAAENWDELSLFAKLADYFWHITLPQLRGVITTIVLLDSIWTFRAFDPVFVDGYATGAVRVRADEATTRLDGRIQANSCRIALLREEEQPTVSAKPSVPMFVDMEINTGRSVELV